MKSCSTELLLKRFDSCIKKEEKTLNRKIFLFCFIKHLHVPKNECFLKNVKKNVS